MLTEVDPEVAAATFARDLDHLWAEGRPERQGWRRIQIDELTEIIAMPARMPNGTTDIYYVRLHASHYGPHPPKVNIVEPETWVVAQEGSPWLPRLDALPPWFGLHTNYGYVDGTQQQLVCFTFNLDYYLTAHTPQPTEIWQQGIHTVAATLNRLHEVLGPTHYRGPSASRLMEAA